ncbi:glycosyltransferase family 2 protein [Aetokthonos hydrillicola Thurmond2011]|jgi:glycosyltransferase involved in cell wall biosynthesis|uniref:Glycosyltransferase family 2 protein n=1 Tax=Aetokthonos hydrillicola Thurmond2011 TaxID=2712845 RepID=A0AAP5I7R9_9CYAN|nr:glycosyltransferase family 2 protein [Aetokthonos hydrillicola]MBO3461159.1 glycosyltransferase family 2 protein [Aetokthonos hydrillicola CCALA 1050]MBW4588630.1 glycosyltransferase family 2 protein [Aetokthonos hydrillicola CCALA 1050]MDR9896305.1 glycosyltransferase family 2 protein [Aetokthonos hydrillicola Thurmond2011]
MKFSVVITTYNRISLLKRSLDSALNQTIPCEVIVADDCSADSTQDYVKDLMAKLHAVGDYRLVYHRNQENKGHSATVNAGVSKATGDWIKFLDDDDYLASNCLEEMAHAIALRKEAVICSCVAAQVDESENELSRTPQVGPGLAFYIPQVDIHYGMLLEALPLGTPVQVACSRDAFLKSGGWDSKFDANCDDIDSWIRIAQFGDAIFLNQCLAYRTIWVGAYNKNFSLKRRLETNILLKEKIYALVTQKHRSSIPEFEIIKNYLKLHWTFVALKQRNIHSFVSIVVDSHIFSFNAWRLLLNAFVARRTHRQHLNISKFVLIES